MAPIVDQSPTEPSVPSKQQPSCWSGCTAGCWPRRVAPRSISGDTPASASNAVVDGGTSGTAEDSKVVLNVGFACARLEKLEDGADSPSHAFYIEALADSTKDDDINALLHFLDHILRLPEIRRGFALVYDLRGLGHPQRSLISQISSWAHDPSREALWSELCHGVYVLYGKGVDDDVNFQVAKTWLWMLFFSHPPGACPAYIITDPGSIGKLTIDSDEDHLCFLPEQDDDSEPGPEVVIREGARSVVGLSAEIIGRSATLGTAVIHRSATALSDVANTAADAVVGVVVGTPRADSAAVRAAGTGTEGSDVATAAATVPSASATAQDSKPGKPVPAWKVAHERGEPLPQICHIGCADIHQGADQKTGLGYLKVIGTDLPITDEGISEMMEFYDAFLYSPTAKNGFSITYDLRNLRSPSMSMIVRLAEWGNEPTRQAMWQLLNVECRVCISSGLRFTISKAALSGFFYICPPVCKTYLLTDPEEDLEDAIVFLPDEKQETAPEDTARRSSEDLQAAFKQKINSEITDDMQKLKGDSAKRSTFEQEVMRIYEEIMYGDQTGPVPMNVDPHGWVFLNHGW